MTEKFPPWPSDGMPYIAHTELEDRRAYLIVSRNLVAGFWDEKALGFHGIRTKFGRQFIDTEYHWDTGGHYGTAKPYEALDLWLPEGVPNKAYVGSFCQECETEVEQIWEDEPSFPSGRRCVGNTHVDPLFAETCDAEGTHCAYIRGNAAMKELLDPIDREAHEIHRHPETKMTEWNDSPEA